MKILAIDPGTTDSGFALLDCESGRLPIISEPTMWNNALLADALANPPPEWRNLRIDEPDPKLVIEDFRSYGQRFPLTCILAVRWSGCFSWAAQKEYGETFWIPRAEVKSILTGRANSKDADVRQAIIDLYGPGKERAIGTVKAPGPLHGVRKDEWSAIGLGLAYAIRYCNLGLEPWAAPVRVEAM